MLWPFMRRGRLFHDVDDVLNEMEATFQQQLDQLSKTPPKNFVRERILPNGRHVKEWGPFVYRYSVTIGHDGRPRIREFGNLKPKTQRGRPQFNVHEQREPLIDVFETNKGVRIVAEVPGIDKSDINLNATAQTLTINVDAASRKYYKEIELPAEIDPQRAKSTYKNGILEVTLPYTAKPTRHGETVPIE
jgi:HSP20 family protein